MDGSALLVSVPRTIRPRSCVFNAPQIVLFLTIAGLYRESLYSPLATWAPYSEQVTVHDLGYVGHRYERWA